jgi:hypothetical protein
MDKVFANVEPLKSGRGIEGHMDSAHVHELHGHQYVVVDRPICDYEQAVKLHAWLGRALGLEKEPRSPTEAFDGGRLG